MLIVVTATQKSHAEFDNETPLGLSLSRNSFDNSWKPAITPENSLGLPAVYNSVIVEQNREHEVVFVHDDLWLDDIFFASRIRAGLEKFDVIGLAGNRVLHQRAQTWFCDDDAQLDAKNLSGVVCHGDSPFGLPTVYGPTPARVELIDGVLIAARISSLLDAGVRFDERFDFHFYDLDFSRQANMAGLTVGTWPVSVTHISSGHYGTDSWRRGLKLYLEKWLKLSI